MLLSLPMINSAMGPFKDLNELKDLLPVLVFLLPGFVSAGIVALLVVRKPTEPFNRVIEALIFTMINLALFTFLKSLLVRIPGLHVNRTDFFTAGNLGLMTFCAVFVGFVWSFEANNQFLFRFLRKLRITSKTTKPSVWTEFIANPQPTEGGTNIPGARQDLETGTSETKWATTPTSRS